VLLKNLCFTTATGLEIYLGYKCLALILLYSWSQDIKNTSNNRGFAFVDYYNHACAEYSRQKMMNAKFKLGDNAPTVSWADPKNADSSAASQVLFSCSFFFFFLYEH
jgi:RNA recognition motif-containing protein